MALAQAAGDRRAAAIIAEQIAYIHVRRGALSEALRILEEQLPVFDQLGDIRSRAVTMGKIADIHFQRGKLAEALRIRQEEVLPVLTELGDARGRSMTLQKIALTLLEMGGWQEGHAEQIVSASSEAYQIARDLGLPDLIAHCGAQFAQVLAMMGRKDRALQVLEAAEAECQKLQDEPGIAHVQKLRSAIQAMPDREAAS